MATSRRRQRLNVEKHPGRHTQARSSPRIHCDPWQAGKRTIYAGIAPFEDKLFQQGPHRPHGQRREVTCKNPALSSYNGTHKTSEICPGQDLCQCILGR